MSIAIVVPNHMQCLRHAPFVLQLHLSLHGASFLQRLRHSLPEQCGRVLVDGIKHTLEKMTGIPDAQPLFSSVGRVMHADFFVEDFDELHTVYEDSTLNLCKSGDTIAEQAHRRMAVLVNITGEQDFTLAVQGRDPVHLVMQVLVLSRTSYATWQQRFTVSGKVLQEKKHLADYFIYPEVFIQKNSIQLTGTIRAIYGCRYEASCKKT